MKGLFITFEGTEGCGKSTQISLLAERLKALGRAVRSLREPGGTPIGEEIRHTLQHSSDNEAMTPETELLLMNASRAQLVREIIRPALSVGEIVLCDRFYDSTVAYQGYGRRLDLKMIHSMIDVAVGETRPDVTLLLTVSLEVSEARRLARREAMLLHVPATSSRRIRGRANLPFGEIARDRMEEADRSFFERVGKGYEALAAADPKRVRSINGAAPIAAISEEVWKRVEPLLPK